MLSYRPFCLSFLYSEISKVKFEKGFEMLTIWDLVIAEVASLKVKRLEGGRC